MIKYRERRTEKRIRRKEDEKRQGEDWDWTASFFFLLSKSFLPPTQRLLHLIVSSSPYSFPPFLHQRLLQHPNMTLRTWPSSCLITARTELFFGNHHGSLQLHSAFHTPTAVQRMGQDRQMQVDSFPLKVSCIRKNISLSVFLFFFETIFFPNFLVCGV